MAFQILPGVVVTTLSMSGFGCTYDKGIGFMCGRGKVAEHIEVVLRGQCWYKRQQMYKTRVAEPYPLELGLQYGDVVGRSLTQRKFELTNELPVTMANKRHDGGAIQTTWFERKAELDNKYCGPDIFCPFVPDGLGAPKGLTNQEHLHFGCFCETPL